MRTLPLVSVVGALVIALLAPASAAGQLRDGLSTQLAIQDGPGGRYQMGGDWLFRRDTADEGVLNRYFNHRGSSGWTKVQIPNAWNAQDESFESMNGDIVWYRKDFRLPSEASGLDWIVRFQNVRYHAEVWLNGKQIGRHSGAYLPWELKLNGLRKGVNRLVLRVDNRRFEDDLPPMQFDDTDQTPAGGWWNYGGMLGEVYLRRVNRIDMEEVEVRPTLPSGATGPARVDWRVKLRNLHNRTQRVRVTGNYGGQRVNLGLKRIPAGGTSEARGRLTVRSPRLWSPPDPQLYDVKITTDAGDAAAGSRRAAPLRRVGDYSLKSGIRSIRVENGRLLVNDQPTNMRGVFVHEDDYVKGSALGNAERENMINRARDLGATLLRTHYPMHPQMHELADRLGVFIWSEVPVFQVPAELLRRSGLRATARDMLTTNVLTNQNHPSVLTWSVSNELRPEPGSIERSYYKESSTLLRKLDPTRPISTVIAGYLDHEPQSSFSNFDMLGFNSYFGWYPGRQASIADRENLSPFLDKMRQFYPSQAIMVTEHGAEANREGPAEERGTYAFQSEFYDYHNRVYATKPWLSGVIGTLRAFRVRPGWEGGNPKPSNNWHEKGVLDFFDNPKPSYAVLQSWFRNTVQYGPGTPR
ncbi:MAG TPA: glycoside hydrolase family 2 TIM barrel-domain containing protein [Thermoleophilaceae bacterium]